MRKGIVFLLLLIAIFTAAAIYFKNQINNRLLLPAGSDVQPTVSQVESVSHSKQTETVIADNLNIPWEIAFLPDRNVIVTERTGTITLITKDGKGTLARISGVDNSGEGGLLGLALHPNFASNGYLYIFLTTKPGSSLVNRVDRYTLVDNSLQNRITILDNIQGGIYHDGGRLKFGPDGYLYIATGDAGNENLSQDTNSLNGKILRVKDDGSIPSGNPFNNAVYAYGLRNPEGLAWDDSGNLWATDHGPSGNETGNDELNLIKIGANYGWPVIRGDQTKQGIETPMIQSGTTDTWAPADALFYKNSIYFTGLRGEALYRAVIENGKVTELKTYLKNQYGRLRALTLGPDGNFYISTSNRDGRGQVREGDDRIIKLDPNTL